MQNSQLVTIYVCLITNIMSSTVLATRIEKIKAADSLLLETLNEPDKLAVYRNQKQILTAFTPLHPFRSVASPMILPPDLHRLSEPDQPVLMGVGTK